MLPLRHISIRVPWHDNGWDGTVCANPAGNMSCLVLKGIGPKRDDTQEMANRGKLLEVLAEDQRPCCMNERGFFMAPFEICRTKNHPYTETSTETHGHFRPTLFRQPRYSADAIPFRWMQRPERWVNPRTPNAPDFRDCYNLDLDEAREPTLKFNTTWVQQRDNHLALLDTFFGHVKPQDSLCFFYAKRTPLAEDSRRVIVGVGRVNHVGGNHEYKYACPESAAPLRALLWERIIQHSIRPDGNDGFNDGFLLPIGRRSPMPNKTRISTRPRWSCSPPTTAGRNSLTSASMSRMTVPSARCFLAPPRCAKRLRFLPARGTATRNG
jgi:hypothetical protein